MDIERFIILALIGAFVGAFVVNMLFFFRGRTELNQHEAFQKAMQHYIKRLREK